MSSGIGDKGLSLKIIHGLEKSTKENRASIEKLSSGQVFSSEEPRPFEKALTERLEVKLRGLLASKRNINDAVSLLQTAEAGFSETSNMLVRMKEINTAAASSTLGDIERKYLFIEYEALFNEIDRIAQSTEFNGLPLLNGKDERVPEQLVLRIDEGSSANNSSPNSEIRLEGLKTISLTTAALGLQSAKDYISTDEGIEISTAQDLMEAGDSRFASIYDEALEKISNYRATYGAIQSRLDRAIEYNDVISENITAAKSKIADVDYAEEVTKLTQNAILMRTGTALLTQSNLASGSSLQLIQSLISL